MVDAAYSSMRHVKAEAAEAVPPPVGFTVTGGGREGKESSSVGNSIH